MKKNQTHNINFILIAFILLSNNGIIIDHSKIVLKNMEETAQVGNLNKTIETLNSSHTDYANYIQTCKTQLATALTTEGVSTSNEDTLETMASNISKVLQARTKNATATADNITKGKTAYVNGKLIEGNGADNIQYQSSYNPFISKNLNPSTGNGGAYSKSFTAEVGYVYLVGFYSSSYKDVVNTLSGCKIIWDVPMQWQANIGLGEKISLVVGTSSTISIESSQTYKNIHYAKLGTEEEILNNIPTYSNLSGISQKPSIYHQKAYSGSSFPSTIGNTYLVMWGGGMGGSSSSCDKPTTVSSGNIIWSSPIAGDSWGWGWFTLIEATSGTISINTSSTYSSYLALDFGKLNC